MKRDARHFAFIKLTRGPAPKLLVVRGAGADDAQIYYGPFHGAQRVGEAVRELNDALGLRDCRLDQPMHFADQPELFQIFPRTPGCIRHEIKKCLGPCVGGCTAQQYDERVRMVRAFLDGADDGPLETLRADMQTASDLMDFERAGDAARQAPAPRGSARAVHPLPLRRRDALVRLHGAGPRRRRPRSISSGAAGCGASTRFRAASRSASACSRWSSRCSIPSERDTAQVPSHEVDELLLLSSWFRRFPAELGRSRDAKAFVAEPPPVSYDPATDPLFGDSASSAA